MHRKKFAKFADLLQNQTGITWEDDFENQVLEYPVFPPSESDGLKGLVFVGLNSAYLVRHDRNDAGIDPDAMACAKAVVREKYPATAWARVLVQHHPISIADPPPRDHLEYLGLSSLLQDFSLVLHGHVHRHQPRQQAQLGGGNVPAVAAGTMFAKPSARSDAIGHEYNIVLLDLTRWNAKVYPRTRDDLGQPWRADNRWTGDDSNFYSLVLHQPQGRSHDPPGPVQSAALVPTSHPEKPLESWASRDTLFEPLLEFAQKRDVVFAVGGAGSGLKTFLAQFKRQLKSNGVRHFSAADFIWIRSSSFGRHASSRTEPLRRSPRRSLATNST